MKDKISSQFTNIGITNADHLISEASSESTSSPAPISAKTSSKFDGLKKRQEFVANEKNFVHTLSTKNKKSGSEQNHFCESTYVGNDKDIGGLFYNKINPKKWTFMDNHRDDVKKKKNYFASDVAKYQYEKVSEEYGFKGQMPSKIKRRNVTNKETLEKVESLGSLSKELMDTFLTDTPNGKSTQKIMDDFDLKATGVEKKIKYSDEEGNEVKDENKIIAGEYEFKDVSITVHVESKDASPKSISPASGNE